MPANSRLFIHNSQLNETQKCVSTREGSKGSAAGLRSNADPASGNTHSVKTAIESKRVSSAAS